MGPFNNFETYLISLPEDQYDALIMERANRLNEKQKLIVLAREVQRKERSKLFSKLESADSNVYEEVLDTLEKMESSDCEHGRNYCKSCLACAEIDHLMFPELFDEDGNNIE